MTDVALREYVERLIEGLDDRLSMRMDLSDQRVAEARQTMNTRLSGMNEFRDALKDQASRMATRAELESLAVQVQDLRREKANLDGRLVVVSAGISLLMSLALWALTRFARP